MKTDEDDEFDRIERENNLKGQPYHYDVFVSVSQRNHVLEEVALHFDKMPFAQSFAAYVRDMKENILNK